jgi:hypothetical protein
VKKGVDCRVFEDQLEALVEGGLPEEGLRQLRLHAESCAECSLLLRTQEHLAAPSLAELEKAVPLDLLASVWPRVEKETSPSRVSGAVSREILPGWLRPMQGRWMIPALAAASLVLLLSTGFLVTELTATRARANRMAEQIQVLDLWRTEMANGRNLLERTALLGDESRSRSRRRALDFALYGGDRVSVQTLVQLLEALPRDEVLFDARRLNGARRLSGRPSPDTMELLDLLDSVVPEPGSLGEVTAGDLARWLAASDLPGSLVLPKSPLKELFS